MQYHIELTLPFGKLTNGPSSSIQKQLQNITETLPLQWFDDRYSGLYCWPVVCQTLILHEESPSSTDDLLLYITFLHSSSDHLLKSLHQFLHLLILSNEIFGFFVAVYNLIPHSFNALLIVQREGFIGNWLLIWQSGMKWLHLAMIARWFLSWLVSLEGRPGLNAFSLEPVIQNLQRT